MRVAETEIIERVDKGYAVMILIEILFDKGLINEATYKSVMRYQKIQCDSGFSHISQVA